MKDKFKKRAEVEGNGKAAELLCSYSVCKSLPWYMCVGWCHKTRYFRPPNLFFGRYPFHQTLYLRKAQQCVCVQSCSVT